MKYAIPMCLLLHVLNGNQIFVKEYTAVELVCSLNQSEQDSLSWYFKKTTPISIQNIVNPKLKFKYRINATLNEEKPSITILNFTESDQGLYSCEGIFDGKHQSGIVNASLCNIPAEISGSSSVLEAKNNAGIIHPTNVLCANATVYKGAENQHEKCLQSSTIKLNIIDQGILEEDIENYKQTTLRKYSCLTLNENQCVKSDITSEIKVEWLSCTGREYEQTEKQLHNFTCDCASSSCYGPVKIYLTNKAFYFENVKHASTGTFICHKNQAGILEEIMTTSKFENADIDFMQLTYTFGGIAAVLATFLLFGSSVIIARFLRHKRLRQNVELQIPVEHRRSFQGEHQNNEHVVPEYLEIIESVNYHSVQWRNNASNLTDSRNTSAYYESIDSMNSYNETTNEMYNVSDNSTNNSIERSVNAVVHQYANTNIGNTYEQLKNPTTDIHTYDNVNDDF